MFSFTTLAEFSILQSLCFTAKSEVASRIKRRIFATLKTPEGNFVKLCQGFTSKSTRAFLPADR